MCSNCHQYDVIYVNIDTSQFGIYFYPVTPLVTAIYEFIYKTGICLLNMLLFSYLIIIPFLFYWSMKYKITVCSLIKLVLSIKFLQFFVDRDFVLEIENNYAWSTFPSWIVNGRVTYLRQFIESFHKRLSNNRTATCINSLKILYDIIY